MLTSSVLYAGSFNKYEEGPGKIQEVDQQCTPINSARFLPVWIWSPTLARGFGFDRGGDVFKMTLLSDRLLVCAAFLYIAKYFALKMKCMTQSSLTKSPFSAALFSTRILRRILQGGVAHRDVKF